MREFPSLKTKPRRAIALLAILVVIMFSFPSKGMSQVEVGSLVVTSVDSSDFPTIKLRVLAKDTSGNVVQELPQGSLIIQENGKVQTILSSEPVNVGFRLAIVIDPGDGSMNTGVTLTDLHKIALEDIRLFAVERPWMETEIDEVTFMVQEGENTSVVVKNTSDPELLLSTVEAYIPPVGAAIHSPEEGDFTRAALNAALKELKLTRPGNHTYPDRAEAIFLYTPGMRADLADVASEAIALGIPIHIILARPNMPTYWSAALRPLAEVTGGTFLSTQEQGDPEVIFEILSHQRIQHRINYETTLGTSGNREVILSTLSGLMATTDYAIDLMAPIVKISSPTEDTIMRKGHSKDENPIFAEPSFITVTAEIEWADDIPRLVSQARLIVDGIAVEGGQVVNNRFEIPWDIRSYGSEIAILVKIEVEIIDTFGFQVRSPSKTIAINYSPYVEPNPLPVPDHTWIYVLIGFASLAIGLSLYLVFSRPRFAPVLQEAREGLIDFVDRVTGKRTAMVARAYLIPEEGFKKRPTKSYELFGTTAIGRSKRHADLLLHIEEEDSPISRLHCTILDEDDHFAIRDEDSSNGTYVNGTKLTPLESVRLKDGDIIEFAPLERGGLSFKFEMAQLLPQKQEELRMTRPGRKLQSASDRDTMNES